MKKFSKLAGATATVMAAAMVLSSTAMADETFKIGGIGPITGAAADLRTGCYECIPDGS